MLYWKNEYRIRYRAWDGTLIDFVDQAFDSVSDALVWMNRHFPHEAPVEAGRLFIDFRLVYEKV